MLFAGVTSLKECIKKVIYLEKASYSLPSLIIVIAATIVKFLFGKYVKKEGRKIHSKSLVATGTDALMDSIVSFSTFVMLIVSSHNFFCLINVVICSKEIEILNSLFKDYKNIIKCLFHIIIIDTCNSLSSSQISEFTTRNL